MTPKLMGTADFGQPDEPEEITVQLVVPEEFAGVSMTELQFRGGIVGEMEVHGGTVSIRASLPQSEYGKLREALRVATQGRGRVEGSPSQ